MEGEPAPSVPTQRTTPLSTAALLGGVRLVLVPSPRRRTGEVAQAGRRGRGREPHERAAQLRPLSASGTALSRSSLRIDRCEIGPREASARRYALLHRARFDRDSITSRSNSGPRRHACSPRCANDPRCCGQPFGESRHAPSPPPHLRPTRPKSAMIRTDRLLTPKPHPPTISCAAPATAAAPPTLGCCRPHRHARDRPEPCRQDHRCVRLGTRFPILWPLPHPLRSSPLAASSARATRHRLYLRGNLLLHLVLYTAIKTQLNHGGDAATYIAKKRTEGKTTREAILACKRHLALRIYKTLKQHTTLSIRSAYPSPTGERLPPPTLRAMEGTMKAAQSALCPLPRSGETTPAPGYPSRGDSGETRYTRSSCLLWRYEFITISAAVSLGRSHRVLPDRRRRGRRWTRPEHLGSVLPLPRPHPQR